MSERIDKIQKDFNEIGSELLQVELALARYKDALSKANDRRAKLLQKIVNLDDEYQKIKYSGMQLPKQGDGNETKANETPSSPSQPITAG